MCCHVSLGRCRPDFTLYLQHFRYVDTFSKQQRVFHDQSARCQHVPLAKALFGPPFFKNKLHLNNDYTYFKTVLFAHIPVK
jgi:hypothetical protein